MPKTEVLEIGYNHLLTSIFDMSDRAFLCSSAGQRGVPGGLRIVGSTYALARFNMRFSAVLGSARARVYLVFTLVLAGAALAASTAYGNSVSLAWDPTTDPTVVGYNVYSGVTSRAYTNVTPAGLATSLTLSNLAPGATYYFAATTFTATGLESDYSVEASYTVPGGATNQPPTLDPLNNVSLNENGPSQIINLTGITSGSTNQTQTLTVSAFSSNPGLVPNPAVNYTSPNTTGTLTFTPASNSYGSVVITVMVDNGGSVSNTVIRTFTVTINSINNPPTIDPLANLVLNENASLQIVNLSGISSGDTNSNQSLVVTAVSSNPGLIPAPAVNFTSPNPTGTLTFTPAANAFGSATITVTVNDGQPANNTATTSFGVTVNQTSTNSAPATWTLWWQQSSGTLGQWTMKSSTRLSASLLQPANIGTQWKIVGSGHFGGTGNEDIILQNTSGQLAAWFMNGPTNTRGVYLSPQLQPGWNVMATGDLNGDGQKDLLLEHTNGWVGVWFMNGTNCVQTAYLNPSQVDPSWRLTGIADLNADGQMDILWEKNDGSLNVWFMNGTNRTQTAWLNPPKVDPSWKMRGTVDLNGDGQVAILWQQDSGLLGYWQMTGTNRLRSGLLSPGNVGTAWRIVGPR